MSWRYLDIELPINVAEEERKMRIDRFCSNVTRLVGILIQEYAMEGPFVVRASAEFTIGIKRVSTPFGNVAVESVLSNDTRVFEVRGTR